MPKTLDFSSLSMTEIIRLQNRLRQELSRRFERQTLMVFSDIVGSTPYFARFGDDVGRQLHQLHFDLLEQSFGATHGRVVDRVGDGAFCVFPTAADGVRGVQAFHRAMTLENATRARAHHLLVRIGLHWGTVLTDGIDVAGDAVHIAARVSKVCEPGSVLLTQQVFRELGPDLRLHCHAAGTRELKGVAERYELLELDWRDPEAFPRRLFIDETGDDYTLPQQDVVTFGRLAEHDGVPANDIVLHHPDPDQVRRISRWHFELRRHPEGLLLRALSNGSTTLIGQPMQVGQDVAVRAGATIRVADTLTLRVLGGASAGADDLSSTTLLGVPVRPAGR